MTLAQVQTGARLAAAQALGGYRDSVPAPRPQTLHVCLLSNEKGR